MKSLKSDKNSDKRTHVGENTPVPDPLGRDKQGSSLKVDGVEWKYGDLFSKINIAVVGIVIIVSLFWASDAQFVLVVCGDNCSINESIGCPGTSKCFLDGVKHPKPSPYP